MISCAIPDLSNPECLDQLLALADSKICPHVKRIASSFESIVLLAIYSQPCALDRKEKSNFFCAAQRKAGIYFVGIDRRQTGGLVHIKWELKCQTEGVYFNHPRVVATEGHKLTEFSIHLVPSITNSGSGITDYNHIYVSIETNKGEALRAYFQVGANAEETSFNGLPTPLFSAYDCFALTLPPKKENPQSEKQTSHVIVPPLKDVDFCLYIALEREMKAFTGVFGQPIRIDQDPNLAEIFYEYNLTTELGFRSIVVCYTGEMTATRAGIATTQLLQKYRCHVFVVAGIAGSLDPDILRVGDVFVPQSIIKSDARGSTSSKGSEKSGADSYRTSTTMINCLRAMSIGQTTELDSWKTSRAPTGIAKQVPTIRLDGPSVVMGDYILATSEKVIRDKAGAKKLTSLNRKIIACDLESAGAAAAVNALPQARQPELLVVRGISDIAPMKSSIDGSFDKLNQDIAARNLASYLHFAIMANQLGLKL